MEASDIEKLVKQFVQENKSASKGEWLKSHIVEILALFVGIMTITIYCLILFKVVKTTESTTITILTSVTNLFIMVMSYYFGSSKGSKDKQAKLDEIENKNVAKEN